MTLGNSTLSDALLEEGQRRKGLEILQDELASPELVLDNGMPLCGAEF